MFLSIMFLVYFGYMLDRVTVIFKFMHRITERLTKYSSGLSSWTLCERGAYTLFCLWMHPPFRDMW